MLISETWLQPANNFIVKGFDTVRKDHQNHKEGVLILIDKAHKYRQIKVKENCGGKIEVCIIETKIRDKPFLIVSCRPNSPTVGF